MPGNRFIQPNAQPRDPNRKMGFENTEREVVATRGVKLKNKAAEQAEKEKKEKEEYMRKFDDRAEQTVKYHQEQGSRAVESIRRFLKMAEDKTLAVNRGGIANDVEREVRQDLIQLALDLNNDENEEDNGKGSVVVLSVVTKIILMYRDRLNDLEYEMQQLRRELKKRNQSSQTEQRPSNADQ